MTLGVEAISSWLDEYPKEIPNRISKDFVIEGIKLILENNSVCFNDTHYLQTKRYCHGYEGRSNLR